MELRKTQHPLDHLRVGGRELTPFEYGVYSKDGERQPVMFWHLVNGRPFIYETQKIGWREGLEGAIRVDVVKPEHTAVTDTEVAAFSGRLTVSHKSVTGVV